MTTLQHVKNICSHSSTQIIWHKIISLCLFAIFISMPTFTQAKEVKPKQSTNKTQTKQNLWRELEKSNWIADGKNDAPRKIYVFTDMNCPYCKKFWADARPWVNNRKVQLRHILVGIIKSDSTAKAAAILADVNPQQAFANQNRSLQNSSRISFDDKEIPKKIQEKLNQNLILMVKSGLYATPAVIWLDDGRVHAQTGVPEHMLKEIFEPK